MRKLLLLLVVAAAMGCTAAASGPASASVPSGDRGDTAVATHQGSPRIIKAQCPAGDNCTYSQSFDVYLWYNGSGWSHFWGSPFNNWRYAVLTIYNDSCCGWQNDPQLFASWNNCGNDSGSFGAIYPRSLLLYNRCGYGALGVLYQYGSRLAHFNVTLYR